MTKTQKREAGYIAGAVAFGAVLFFLVRKRRTIREIHPSTIVWEGP